MSDHDFNLITEQDKQDVAYGACVGGMAITVIGVGRFLGVQGVVAGAVVGAAWGLLTCKRLAPAIKQKLFTQASRLDDGEVVQALQALRETKPGLSKPEALRLLAGVRQEIAGNPARYRAAA